MCVSLSQHQTVSVKVSVCAGVSLSQCQIVGVKALLVKTTRALVYVRHERMRHQRLASQLMKDWQVKQQDGDKQPLTLWDGASLGTHTPSMCTHTHDACVHTHTRRTCIDARLCKCTNKYRWHTDR